MAKLGLKTVTAILMLGRRKKQRVNWTLAIAVVGTLVTAALVSAYLFERFGGK